MRVLGIDPGSIVTGYGIVEDCQGKLTHVDSGTISLSHINTFPQRLREIYERLTSVISSYSPECAAIEEVFFAKNVRSAIKLSHARGVAILAAENAHLPLYEYSPLEIKQSLVGYGRASKDQIEKMTRYLLGIPQVKSLDASDALAVAICHLHSAKLRERIGRST
jgi:crossover junction endodeoxyribonuclease RuvC